MACMNNRQKMFAREYLVDYNGKAAAIRAGYQEANAEATARKLLSDPDVIKFITQQTRLREKRLELSADAVLGELMKHAFFNPLDFYDEDGSLKAISEIPPDAAVNIASLDVVDEFAGRGINRQLVGRSKKVRFTDKIKALELLAKHLGVLDKDRQADTPPVQIKVVYGKKDKVETEGEDE